MQNLKQHISYIFRQNNKFLSRVFDINTGAMTLSVPLTEGKVPLLTTCQMCDRQIVTHKDTWQSSLAPHRLQLTHSRQQRSAQPPTGCPGHALQGYILYRVGGLPQICLWQWPPKGYITIPCRVLLQQNTYYLKQNTIWFASCQNEKMQNMLIVQENANALASSIKGDCCFKTCSTKWDKACTNINTLWSLNTDEKFKSEEEGTVNSLSRSQLLSGPGQQICFCCYFVQLWLLVDSFCTALVFTDKNIKL